MAEYIDVDKLQKEFEEVCVGECDCCKEESCPVYTQSTVKAIPIPDGATNGDMINAMFPNIEVKPQMDYDIKMGVRVIVHIDEHTLFELWFPSKWWDTPYKGVKNDTK